MSSLRPFALRGGRASRRLRDDQRAARPGRGRSRSGAFAGRPHRAARRPLRRARDPATRARSTRSSRGISSVASSLIATKMKSGAPNGAIASMRAEAGRSTPTVSRARTSLAADLAAAATSAVSVRTPRHSRVACGMIADASPAGESAVRQRRQLHQRRAAGGRQEHFDTKEQRTPRAYGLELAFVSFVSLVCSAHFLSFCRADRIFLSMSDRSMESPSPASARVHAAIASS